MIRSILAAIILITHTVAYAGFSVGFPSPGPGAIVSGGGETLGANFCPNSTFDVLTPWAAHNAYVTPTVSGGELVLNGTTSPAGGTSLAPGLTVGHTYRVTASVRVYSGTGSASVHIVNAAKSAFVHEGPYITSTEYTQVTFDFVATETGNLIYIRVSSTNPATSIRADNVEIREVL